MAQTFRIFGSELSPYSVKVRSYFRFKDLPFEWLIRNPSNQATFEEYARLPLIPLVITPDDEGLQDSTPTIEKLEARYPTPPLQPADSTLAFLSALIEEYADEWGNKPMFHYRWTYEPDQLATAREIAIAHVGATEGNIDEVASKVRQRMVPRLAFVGSSPATLPIIEGSFARLLEILEAHLAQHDYLLGDRPALADLGLFAQLYECSRDPTPGAMMKATAAKTLAWVKRMLEPKATGDFARWLDLAPTLMPLLSEQVGAIFLPWSSANAAALAAGRDSFTVELDGRTFAQQPQKYHARSLSALRAKYTAVSDKGALDPILESTGCLAYLR